MLRTVPLPRSAGEGPAYANSLRARNFSRFSREFQKAPFGRRSGSGHTRFRYMFSLCSGQGIAVPGGAPCDLQQVETGFRLVEKRDLLGRAHPAEDRVAMREAAEALDD